MKKIIIIVSFVFLCLLGGYLYFYNEVKSHYSSKVITIKKANLYDKNKKIIGNVEKGFTFEIESKNNSYFKVKNYDYYLYYKDVKKSKKIIKDKINPNYLLLGKKIKTDNKNIFYLDDEKILKINKKMELNILYMDEKYYYVNYLNRILKLKKENYYFIEDNKNSNEAESNFISIVNYPKICDNTFDNSCIKIEKVKEQLNYLKENEYYTINVNEYINWHNGNLRLKEKAILLTTNEKNSIINDLKSEYKINIELLDKNISLEFSNDNKTTNKESNLEKLPRYVIYQNTTLDKFKQITLGKDVYYEILEPNQKIAVLNYHFFYDSSTENNCNEIICLDTKKFRQQLDYLKENNFKTLTIEEFRAWMYGEIELPKKSVLLTVDDGACGTGKHNGNKLIPILEEYNMHATLFLISGWWDIENYRSSNLDIQSHSFNMHDYGSCGKGQVVCSSKEELTNDLKKSLEIVKDNTSFCFPFYNYSKESIETVKEVGFKIAFIGGYKKASRMDDKYMIPRFPIYDSTSLQEFINMVN